ncbi:MAG TPA: sigma-70 family RNA polymerase sigma factor [Pyrinomonadaceae bacterium]|nr:sigma-70 family RNA polymerase sigma factor [Pyrinomonadaceae bacterium]
MDEQQPSAGRKASWVPSERSFNSLLKWLDNGTDSAGSTYVSMRGKLVTYFDRKGCLDADELADETLTRVARRLEEEGTIESDAPAKYCYITAKFVFLEDVRSKRRLDVPLDSAENAGQSSFRRDEVDTAEAAEMKERKLDCLEKCVGELDVSQRDVVIRYYHGAQRTKIDNRRQMAEEYGISMNALTIRTFRIRERLEKCVTKCAGSDETDR